MRKSIVLKNSLGCSVLFLISSLNSLTSSSCPCLYTMYFSNFPSLFPSSQSICFLLFHLFSILIKSLEFFLASLNSFPYLSQSVLLLPIFRSILPFSQQARHGGLCCLAQHVFSLMLFMNHINAAEAGSLNTARSSSVI